MYIEFKIPISSGQKKRLLEKTDNGDIEWFVLNAQEQIDHCKSLIEDGLTRKIIKPQLLNNPARKLKFLN